MSQSGKTGCCAPDEHRFGKDRDAGFLKAAMQVPAASEDTQKVLRSRLKPIPGGIFEMGTRRSSFADDLDSPRRKVKLSGYRMSPTAVTNAEYARFVSETGYKTVAEQEGWSFVFHLLLDDATMYTEFPPSVPWWRKVDGSCWSAPEGPGSDITSRGDHPVVHIAWYDALAYCNWSGLLLPTEAQWERAARGGMANRKFPWGDELMPDGKYAMCPSSHKMGHQSGLNIGGSGSVA